MQRAVSQKRLRKRTETGRICFLAPRYCATPVTEQLPMNVG
ncbi:hypothetical protein DW66_4267 [Pseudomonas putida]|nr:hypothetical protein DW66_4267 [Pseudomonas putida]